MGSHRTTTSVQYLLLSTYHHHLLYPYAISGLLRLLELRQGYLQVLYTVQLFTPIALAMDVREGTGCIGWTLDAVVRGMSCAGPSCDIVLNSTGVMPIPHVSYMRRYSSYPDDMLVLVRSSRPRRTCSALGCAQSSLRQCTLYNKQP